MNKLCEKKINVINMDWSETIEIKDNTIIRHDIGKYAQIIETKKNQYTIRRIDNNELEYLSYNESSDNWWCYSCSNLKPVRSIPESEFKEETSSVIICNKLKFINFSIAKNCNSTILLNAMNIDQNLKLTANTSPWYGTQKEKTLHNLLYYDFYRENINKYKNYKKFIIYRDPIDRFVNLANYMFIGKGKFIGRPFINYSLDKKNFIDELLKLAEIYNSNDDIYTGEQHILSQSRILSRITPDDIDDMVLVKDLNKYLMNELHIKNFVWVNKSHEHLINAEDLTEEQRKKIKEIYIEDYDLYKNYADKIYFPSKAKVKKQNYHNTLLIFKSVGYRLFGTMATIIISFIFTGSVKISLSIGIFEVLSKIVLYFVYDKLWEKFIKRINEKNM